MQPTTKSVVFVPFFGKLPDYFNLWLHSCSYHENFSFIVFTDDDTEYSIPANVSVVRLSFSDFREKIQKKFDFRIFLDNPYKLCDFKPAYGYLFSDFAKGYDYWGHCDLDLIIGNLEKYLPKESFDKVSYEGHFCLYRNKKEVNEAFMENSGSKISYRDIFSNNVNFAFDEIGDYGINEIFTRKGFKIYDFRAAVADIDCRKKRIFCRKASSSRKMNAQKTLAANEEVIVIFDNGKVFSYSKNTRKKDKEYAYVHFQKRKMINQVSNPNKFLITHNRLTDYPDNEKDLLSYFPKSNLNFRWFSIKVKTTPNRIKRELAIMKLRHKEKQ